MLDVDASDRCYLWSMRSISIILLLLLTIAHPFHGRSQQVALHDPRVLGAYVTDADALPDGSVLFSGTYDNGQTIGGQVLSTPGQVAGFICLRSSTGEWAWVRGISSPVGALVHGSTLSADGGIIVAGTASTPLSIGNWSGDQEGDLFLAKLNMNGEPLWVLRANNVASVQDVISDGQGGAYISGNAASPGMMVFGNDSVPTGLGGAAFLAHAHADGSWDWLVGMTSLAEFIPRDLVLDGLGRAVIAGSYVGYWSTIGTDTVWANTASYFLDQVSLFVACFSPAGETQWIASIDSSFAGQSAAYTLLAPPGEPLRVFGGGSPGIPIAGGSAGGFFLARLGYDGQWLTVANTPLGVNSAAVLSDGRMLVSSGAAAPAVVAGTPIDPGNASQVCLAGICQMDGQWSSVVQTYGTGTSNAWIEPLPEQGRAILYGYFDHDLWVGTDTISTQIVGAGMFMDVDYSSVGMREIGTSGMRVWPLPASDQVNLLLPSDAGRGELSVYDAQGRTVLLSGIVGGVQHVVDLRSLRGGIYLLRCGSYSVRLIKE